MSVYRYKLAVNLDMVKKGIDPAIWGSLSIAPVTPISTVDITIASTDREDLDAIMWQLGWEFDSIVVPP